jgi:hypothetical protein
MPGSVAALNKEVEERPALKATDILDDNIVSPVPRIPQPTGNDASSPEQATGSDVTDRRSSTHSRPVSVSGSFGQLPFSLTESALAQIGSGPFDPRPTSQNQVPNLPICRIAVINLLLWKKIKANKTCSRSPEHRLQHWLDVAVVEARRKSGSVL